MMARGTRIERDVDRAQACANCRWLRFLQYSEPTRFGVTGIYFCRVEYREIGEFDAQPWDFTCGDFQTRVRRHDQNKCVDADAVPIVVAMEGWPS